MSEKLKFITRRIRHSHTILHATLLNLHKIAGFWARLSYMIVYIFHSALYFHLCICGHSGNYYFSFLVTLPCYNVAGIRTIISALSALRMTFAQIKAQGISPISVQVMNIWLSVHGYNILWILFSELALSCWCFWSICQCFLSANGRSVAFFVKKEEKHCTKNGSYF
jgi:hypothetical protein